MSQSKLALYACYFYFCSLELVALWIRTDSDHQRIVAYGLIEIGFDQPSFIEAEFIESSSEELGLLLLASVRDLELGERTVRLVGEKCEDIRARGAGRARGRHNDDLLISVSREIEVHEMVESNPCADEGC